MRGNPTHGHTVGRKFSPTYSSWVAMCTRCRNPSFPAYPRYGGAGITVCERWLMFENFLSDMGERPLGTSIDRIDGTKGYQPENCRWATSSMQNTNKACNPHFAFDGKNLTIRGWAEELGLDRSTLQKRIYKLGWPLEKALSPVRRGRWGEIAQGLRPGKRRAENLPAKSKQINHGANNAQNS